MATAIQSGDMSASITNGGKIDVRGRRKIAVSVSGTGVGNPSGTVGIKMHFMDDAKAVVRTEDIGSITGGNFNYTGAQPNGSGAAWAIFTEFESAADLVEVYYTRASGGAANTSFLAIVAAK